MKHGKATLQLRDLPVLDAAADLSDDILKRLHQVTVLQQRVRASRTPGVLDVAITIKMTHVCTCTSICTCACTPNNKQYKPHVFSKCITVVLTVWRR